MKAQIYEFMAGARMGGITMVLALAAFLAVPTGCAPESAGVPADFQGKFFSDKEATEQWLRSQKSYPPFLVNKLGQLLGRTTVELQADSLLLHRNNTTETLSLTLVEKGDKWMTIKVFSRTLNTNMTWKVEYDAEGIWTSTDYPFKGFRERYRRVP